MKRGIGSGGWEALEGGAARSVGWSCRGTLEWALGRLGEGVCKGVALCRLRQMARQGRAEGVSPKDPDHCIDLCPALRKHPQDRSARTPQTQY